MCIRDRPCTAEENEKLTPGTKIKVTGYKAEWSGEVEITDATITILEGSWIAEEACDVTAVAGTDDLIKHINELVVFKGMTVAASTDADGNEVPFLYKWDGSGSQGDDLYFNVTLGDKTYTFTVNRGSDSGIAVDLCAITENGEVLGLVTEVGAIAAVL